MEFTWNAILGLVLGFITGTVAPKAMDRWLGRRDRDLDALTDLAAEYERVSTLLGTALRDRWHNRDVNSEAANEAQRSFWTSVSRVEVVASKAVVEAAWKLRDAVHEAASALNDRDFARAKGIAAIGALNSARHQFYADIRKNTRLGPSRGYPARPEDSAPEET